MVSAGAKKQIGIFALAYLLYSAARWLTIGDLGAAKANADWILDFEHQLGVADEASVQSALTGTWALWLLNHLYLAAQLVVLPGALIFLYHRSQPLYEKLRNTILATWLLSIPIYAAFPVAPPRLADIGLVDTITHQTGVALDSGLTTSFYNELAAVPSLHVGFAVAIGIALAAAVRHPAAEGDLAAVGADDRPRRRRHRQPLRVRHRRRRGRRRARLRPRHRAVQAGGAPHPGVAPRVRRRLIGVRGVNRHVAGARAAGQAPPAPCIRGLRRRAPCRPPGMAAAPAQRRRLVPDARPAAAAAPARSTPRSTSSPATSGPRRTTGSSTPSWRRSSAPRSRSTPPSSYLHPERELPRGRFRRKPTFGSYEIHIADVDPAILARAVPELHLESVANVVILAGELAGIGLETALRRIALLGGRVVAVFRMHPNEDAEP